MVIRYFMYAFGFVLAYIHWWWILLAGTIIGVVVEIGNWLQNRPLQSLAAWFYWGMLFFIGRWMYEKLEQAEQILQVSMDIFWLLFLVVFSIVYGMALFVAKRSGIRLPDISLPQPPPKPTSTPPPDGKEWELITFDIGVNRTKEKYRLGGK